MNRSRLLSQFMRSALLSILLFGLMTIPVLHAQQTKQMNVADLSSQEVTIKQAISLALANNSNIKRAWLSVEDADEQVKIAWSNVMPEISSNISYTRNLEIPVNFVPAKFFDPTAPADELIPLQFGTDNNWDGGFSVSQTIFRGEAIIGIATSSLYKSAQQENLRATTQQIITQTRLQYYNVLIAKERLGLQEQAIRRIQENLNENRKRYDAGLLDEYDVLQLEVQLANERPQLTEAKYALDQAYRKLLETLGLPIQLEIRVVGDLSEFDIRSDQAVAAVNKELKEIDTQTPLKLDPSDDLMMMMEDWRGDLRILDVQTQLKDREITAIKSRFLPTLEATYNLQWTASQAGTPNFFGESNQRARFQTLGFNLSVPLFTGLERISNVNRAKIEQRDIEEQIEQTKRTAKSEIISAQETIEKTYQTLEARRLAIKQARRGYDIAKSRLQNGVGSQLDVSNAELQVQQAELNYASMVFEYLSAKAQYDLSIGQVPMTNADPEPANSTN
ncbi:MAG: TolC family protein [Bacteroidota bacterium]